jgi:peptidoglycan hydrolase-like protein with peptidoglycan-binding domain
MKKYYDILGLDMSASIEAVEQAYKELSEVWHPQTYQNLPRYRRKAEIKSKAINEAYERIRAFLLAKAPDKKQDEDQKDHVPPGGTSLTSEPEALPPKENIQSQISKPPHRKIWLYILIAIAVVLGTLMFYQILDRQKPKQQDPQTAVTEPEKPTPAISSQEASTVPLQKESESEPSGEFTVTKQLPSGKSAGQKKYAALTDKPKIMPQIKADYNALLTEESLSKYNQDRERIKRAQKGLVANGYDPGPLDGIIGPRTIAALKQFASDHAVEADGLFAADLTGAVLVYAEVAATHPDWHSIIGSDDFARWLDRQSYYQKSTIENLKKTATARQVVDILNRYKFNRATP